ncbi:MAG: MFS transporter [Chloroflexi bacterium]|nr:MFS transporter [Chloroflexota bacterium]
MQSSPTRQAWSDRLQAFGALRNPGFRVFWLALVLFVTGFNILSVAQAWLLYDLTGSPVFLGLIGAAMAVPTILMNFFGGVIADRLDRRRLIILTQSLTVATMLVLLALVATGRIEAWHLLATAAIMGAVQGFDQPARQALMPQLIDRKDLMNAVALNSAVWQGGRIVGPAIGGVLIGSFGVTVCFAVTTAAFLGAVLLFVWLRSPQNTESRRAESFRRQMGEGLAFVAKTPLFASLIGISFFNSFFGLSFIFLLPIFAKDILNAGPSGLGILIGASGVGALAGTVFVAAAGSRVPKSLVILAGGVLFGVTLALFAFSQSMPLSLAILLISGAANSVYTIAAMTVLQLAVPNALRGRVMGIWGLTWAMMPLGGLQAGIVAHFIGAPGAVAIGAGLIVLFTMAVAGQPVFRRRLLEASEAHAPAHA